MSMHPYIKNYGLFIFSVFILGLVIALVTEAQLGTTAITSAPYVLSLFTPLSFGMFTMIFNILYVLIEKLIMRSEFKKIQYLQFLVGPILGWAIDFWSQFVVYFARPFYMIRLLMVVIGCFIIACSVILQLKANVINNPAEGVVKAIATKANISFGTVKIGFDVSLVCIAALTSLVVFKTIHGIREGTLISAVITGMFIKWLQRMLRRRDVIVENKV